MSRLGALTKHFPPLRPRAETEKLWRHVAADEAVFDKITMSAFEGTPLDIALRDCGIAAFAIVGIAMEIGIEPTVRHGADLGYIPVVIKDACGFGRADAAARSIASLEFAGDALLTTVEEVCAHFHRIHG